MKTQKQKLKILLAAPALLAALVFCAGAANAAGTKQYEGKNYTVIYPASGFDDKLQDFNVEISSIIPFVESYGAIKFDHIKINVLSNSKQLGIYTADSLIEQMTINIPAQYYNAEAVYHEFCHLAQYHLSLPAWFAESHAEVCVRRYFEHLKAADMAKEHDDFYAQNQKKYENVQSRIPEDLPKVNKFPDDVSIKSFADEYFMMKAITNVAPMAKILPKLREDFDVTTLKGPHRYDIISNDNIICDVNAVTSKDVFSIFQKYGFKIPDCSAKPKPAPEPVPAAPNAAASAANSSDTSTGILISLTGILAVVLLSLMIFGIFKLIKFALARFRK